MEEKTTYMSNDFIEQGNETRDWTDLFIATIDKAMEKTNVASLAFVSKVDAGEINGIKIAQVKPFPLDSEQEEFIIDAFYNETNIAAGSIVVILYTDRTFRNNLNDNKPKVVNTRAGDLHSISNAVIVKVLKQ